jgi:hypothetical protein
VDFGRILPGLLLVLLGVGLFAFWLVLVFISFFSFFFPALHWVFYFALDVLVASLALVGIGVLVMLTGLSGWWSSQAPVPESGWAGGFAWRRAKKDRLRIGERVGELFGLFVSGLVLLFFYENQVQHTGFFTPGFGPTEQALFYGPWFFGAFVSLARVAYGRRNAIRPLDVVQALLTAVAAFWLLSVFPFDFAHLPDLLPKAIRFMFLWVSNDIGALVLVLAGIGSAVSAVYTSVLYLVVRSHLSSGAHAPVY